MLLTDLPWSFLYTAFLNPFKLMIRTHSDGSDSELAICECWDGVNEPYKQEGHRFWGVGWLGIVGWVLFPRIHVDLETQNDLIREHGLQMWLARNSRMKWGWGPKSNDWCPSVKRRRRDIPLRRPWGWRQRTESRHLCCVELCPSPWDAEAGGSLWTWGHHT